ncbi:hypothetical protein FH972_023553 [Carpinus fangiana]|uniref:Store-operated calcium entry-associated regulatory factor n=1 Tax=Carpinus fangiana TaxID=176857 RepID=A0A5N6KVR9_9ROSI|nr:hypothetical protein FH972_023553 [Carpinus fangiana]
MRCPKPPPLHPGTLALTLLALLLPATATAARSAKPKDAVQLSSIQALTFRKDALTTHRRVSAIPQLTCVGGSAHGLFTPDAVRCQNAGAGYSAADVEWTCTAALPPEFKLGATDVVCEGYDSSADEWVLKGSCGLEYRLVLTERGEEKYGTANWWGGRSGGTGGGERAKRSGGVGEGVASLLFWGIFAAVVLFMVYSAWNNANAPGRQRRAPRRTYGGGGGGGDNDDHDPPPPYSPNPRPSRKYSKQSSYWGQGGGWQPGFWSGAAAGAAGGYFAGSRGQNRQQQQRSSSWFGGGARADPGEGSSRMGGRSSGWGGGSSAPSPWSERYNSTGFGGTRRR